MQNLPTNTTTTPPHDPLKNIPCIHCAYPLQGLPLQSSCPECGTPMEHSFTHYKLTGVLDSWFTSVRIGIVLYAISILMFSILSALSILQLLRYLPPLWWYSYHLQILSLILPFFGTIARWWGLQLIATRKSTIDGPLPDGSSERLTRTFATVALLIAYGDHLALYQKIPFLSLNAALTLWTMTSSFFIIISMWFLYRVFENIAKSIGQNTLRRHAVMIRYILVAALFAPLLANFFGSLLTTLDFDRETTSRVLQILLWLLVVPATLADVIVVIWSLGLFIRLYHWLGLFRTTAPANPNKKHRPSIPSALQKIFQLLKHSRNLASDPGHYD